MSGPGAGSASGSADHFDRGAWWFSGGILLLLVASLLHAGYRFSLPSDGWSIPFELTTGRQTYTFGRYLGRGNTPIQPGDQLIAIEGQDLEKLVSRALQLAPARPEGWRYGSSVSYAVLREAEVVRFQVTLQHRPPGPTLGEIGRQLALIQPNALIQVLISLFVFYRRPRNRGARLLLLYTTGFFVTTIANQPISGQNGGTAELFYPAAYWPGMVFNLLLFPLLVVPTIANLFLNFPLIKEPIARRPRLTLALIYGLPPLLLAAGAARAWDQPLLVWRTPFELGASFIFPISVLVAILSLAHTLRTAQDPIVRARARWLVLGIAVGIGIGDGLLFFLPQLGLLPETLTVRLLSWLLGLAFPVTIGIAILRYRLFEIDVLINRALVYGSLTGTLALAYFASVVLLQRLLPTQTQLATVLSTLLVAALFSPLRARLQKWIDRRFYRSKYDAARTLAWFSQQVRDQVEPGRLAGLLLGAVNEALQPAQSSLWLEVAPSRDGRLRGLIPEKEEAAASRSHRSPGLGQRRTATGLNRKDA